MRPVHYFLPALATKGSGVINACTVGCFIVGADLRFQHVKR